MDDDSRNKWIGGILIPGIALVWGISSLISGEIVIPIRRFKSLPFYQHIPLHGWPAIFMSAVLIAVSLAMHVSYFGNRYPNGERYSSQVSTYAALTAGVLFAAAIFVWLAETFIAFCR